LEIGRRQKMLGVTLRYPYDVRDHRLNISRTLKDEKVLKDILDLAIRIVETKRGDFHPEKFEDDYEQALRKSLRRRPEAKDRAAERAARSNAKVVGLICC
jgi:DNA end-binding protein Ku